MPSTRPGSASGYLSAIRMLAGDLFSRSDIEDALEHGLDIVLETLGCEAGAVYLSSAGGAPPVLRAVRTEGVTRSAFRSLASRRGLVRWVLEHRQAAVILNPGEDTRTVPLRAGKAMPGAVASAPIEHGAKVLGTLVVAWPAGSSPHDDQVDFLHAAAVQIGSALALFDLSQSRAQSLSELKELHRSATQIGEGAALEPVLDSALSFVANMLGIERCAIYELVESEGRFRCLASKGVAPEVVRVMEEHSSRSPAFATLKALSPVSVRGAEDYMGAPEVVEAATKWGITSALLLPVVMGGQSRGVLSLYGLDIDSLGPSDIQLAELLAAAVAGALTSVRFHENLRDSAARMRQLHLTSMRLLQPDDPERLAVAATELGRGLLRVDAMAVHLYDESYRLLKLTSAHPPDSACAPTISALNRGLLGKAVQRGGTVVQPLRLARANFDGFAMARPLRSQDELVGVLSAYRERQHGSFLPEEVEFFELFGSIAAATIHNAKLFARSEEFGVVSERNRIASEMHDSVGNDMAALLMRAELARDAVDRDASRSKAELDRIVSGLQNNIAELRRILFALRPLELEQRGLRGGIEKLAEDFQRRNETPILLDLDSNIPRLGHRVEYTVFRVVQESLNNVRKYAKATSVSIAMHTEGDRLFVVVADDGQGFDVSDVKRRQGLGLISLEERIRSVGGELEIVSVPGQGTRVTASFFIVPI